VNSISSRIAPARETSRAGELVREWRTARRLSQLDLALEAGISPRHLSCVETGKSQASRELIVRLAATLELPLRERNALLKAAGYAAIYPESDLTAPQLAQVRRAIDAILAHQEPFPAFVLDRRWNILMANQAAVRVNGFLLDGKPSPHSNMIRHFFDPNDLRAAVANWEEVAGDLIRHLHNEARMDAKARALLDEVLAYPDVPSQWRTPDLRATPAPLVSVVFRHGERELRFFSTITTFGTPRDVTLDELHIECTFPADESTAEFCRSIARTTV
jgi:transcriptional regulator with XRE-family HTH domain